MDIAIIIGCLLLSAFFSGMEIAYLSSNKIHIEIEKKQNDFLAKILAKLTKKPSKFIATMLIGNNIALVLYGFYMGDLLVELLSTIPKDANAFVYYLANDLQLLTQTILSTIVILVTAEFLPKVLFQIYSNTLLKFFALPAYLFYVCFSFISSFIIWISDAILRTFFKTKGDEVQLAFSKVELGDYISEQMEAVDKDADVDSEIQIFQNALEFSGVKAREAMVPRTEILAIELDESVAELNRLFVETGYSKILVYQDTMDDIIGYVHSFDLFKRPKNIRAMMLEVEFVPETMLVNDILNLLTKKRRSIAIVLDEYGGTSGILTVEDIIEELFGEIQDEHDSVAFLEQKIDATTYRFSARLEVDYLNETYKLDLPESENYETLGGLICNEIADIPEQGAVVSLGEYRLTITAASHNKIEVVEIKLEDLD